MTEVDRRKSASAGYTIRCAKLINKVIENSKHKYYNGVIALAMKLTSLRGCSCISTLGDECINCQLSWTNIRYLHLVDKTIV